MPKPRMIFARKRRLLGIKRTGNNAVINANEEPKRENTAQKIVYYDEQNKPAVGARTLDKRLIKNNLKRKAAHNKLASQISTLLKMNQIASRFNVYQAPLSAHKCAVL